MANQFHVYGTLTDSSSFDRLYDTWSEVTAYILTLKETLKTITINGEGVSENRLPSTLNSLFYDYAVMEECYLYGIVTSKVTDMSSTFRGTTEVRKINLYDYDVSGVLYFSYLFAYSGLLDFSGVVNWVLLSAINMRATFLSVQATRIDISRWYAPNCKEFYEMCNASKNKVWDFSNIGATPIGQYGTNRMFLGVYNAIINLSGLNFTAECGSQNMFAESEGVTVILSQLTFQPIQIDTLALEGISKLIVPSHLKYMYVDDQYWEVLADRIEAMSEVPVRDRLPAAIMSSQAYSSRRNTFHVTGSLIDGSVFDMYMETWSDVTAFLPTVKSTLKVITINGDGVEYEKLPSTLSQLFDGFLELEQCRLYGIVTGKVVSLYRTWQDCQKLYILNTEDLDVSSIRSFFATFLRCINENLSLAGLKFWNVISATTFQSMFLYCRATDIDTSNWYAPNCTGLYSMCNSSWNPIWDFSNLGCKVTNLSLMCAYASRAQVLNLSGVSWDESANVTNFVGGSANLTLIMGQEEFQPMPTERNGLNEISQIQVPPPLVEQYKTTEYWSLVQDKIVAPAEVPYVSAMGNSYINTGIVPTSNTMMEVDVQSTNTSAVSFVAGSRIAAATQAFSIVDLFNSNGGWRLDVGNIQSSSTTFAPDIVEGERVKLKVTSDEVSINGNAKSITPQTIVSSLPLYLGNCNTNGTPYQVGIVGNIYKSLIDDVTFTPAVYDGIGGFFDSRTGVWLRSEGAEDFIEDVFTYTGVEIVLFEYPEIPVEGGTVSPLFSIRASWESGSKSGTEQISPTDSRLGYFFVGEVTPFAWEDQGKGTIAAPTMGITLGSRQSGAITMRAMFEGMEAVANVDSVIQSANTRVPVAVQSFRALNEDGSAYTLPITAAGTGSSPVYMSWQVIYNYSSGAIGYADNVGILDSPRNYVEVDSVNRTISVDSFGTEISDSRIIDVNVLYIESGESVVGTFSTTQSANQLWSCEILNITPHEGMSSSELPTPISAGGIESPSYIRMSWDVENRYSSGALESLSDEGTVSIVAANGFSGSSNKFYVEDRLANKGSARSTTGSVRYLTPLGVYKTASFTLTQAENVSWYDKIEVTPSFLSFNKDGGEKEVQVRLFAEFSSGTVLNYDYGGIHLQVSGIGFSRGNLYGPRTIEASVNGTSSARSGTAQASFEGVYSNVVSLSQEAGEAPPPKQTIYVYKNEVEEGIQTSSPVTAPDGLSISLSPSGATFVIPYLGSGVDIQGYGAETIQSIVPTEDAQSTYVIQY